MRLHIVQMCSVNNKATNINNLLEHFARMQVEENDMIFLPENSLFMRASQTEKVSPFHLEAGELDALSDYCKKAKVFLHLGAIAIEHLGKVYNTSVYILPDGSIEDSYRKIHLFDVDVEGERLVRESDAFHAGESLSTFYFQNAHFGQTICYDLRFSNLFLAYADLGVDVILVPSSFFYITGKDHWEVLLRSRAIETQAFIIAAAQGGTHMGQQKTWGHSMVIDPWGHILGVIKEVNEKPQSLLVEIDLSKVAKVRRQIPLAVHRKPGFSS